MANFGGHLFWGLGTGVILSKIGVKFHYIQPIEIGIVTILAMTGASIPDIDYGKIDAKDSKTGEIVERESKPFQIFTKLLSLIISIPSAYYFSHYRFPVYGVIGTICSFFIFYIIFYLSIRWLLKNVTTHRGVMHSIPFAILSAEVAYLIFSSEYTLILLTVLFDVVSKRLPHFAFESLSKNLPEYSAIAVFFGFLSHLIVDEVYSIGWGGRKRTSYFRTALNIYSDKSTKFANFALYSIVIALAVISFRR
jgi:hypothetical protein